MRPKITRRRLLAAAGVAGATALAGCIGSGKSLFGSGSNTGGGPLPPTADQTPILPMSPDRLRQQARSGGPPKDGIPSIDNPKFITASEADTNLDPGDIVFGVARNGVVKAYPQNILVHHEIVNDVIGGEPVSVTYCPLTGTVLGFNRGETTFGVSGRLINNNLVMYDRSSETWWPQMLATSIPGPWNNDPGTHSLQEFRAIWTTWDHWKNQHPDTKVLSEDTGIPRNYNQDPYGSYNPRGGYYVPSQGPLFTPLSEDDRYPPKKVFLGARTPDGAVAFLKDAIREKKLMSGEIAGTPVVAVYDPRYDTAYIYRNPDDMSFTFENGRVVDPTGTDTAPDALPLERIHTYDTMWFAWIGYYPDTNVYE